MQIRHIFFDLDHTLWDFETNSARAFDFIFRENKLGIDLKAFLEIYVPVNQQYWKMYREEKITKSALRHARLRDTFRLLNFEVSDDLIYHLSEVYIDNLPNYNHLFDDAVEVLEYLRPKYQMHIITNGFEEVQTRKLINSKIVHFFDKIITSENVGVKKPNPKIFNHALEVAKAKPENSMMIGDNFEADILGAHQVGMKTIFFNYHKEQVDHQTICISKLIEIKNHL